MEIKANPKPDLLKSKREALGTETIGSSGAWIQKLKHTFLNLKFLIQYLAFDLRIFLSFLDSTHSGTINGRFYREEIINIFFGFEKEFFNLEQIWTLNSSFQFG